jgi:hypothetical protein
MPSYVGAVDPFIVLQPIEKTVYFGHIIILTAGEAALVQDHVTNNEILLVTGVASQPRFHALPKFGFTVAQYDGVAATADAEHYYLEIDESEFNAFESADGFDEEITPNNASPETRSRETFGVIYAEGATYLRWENVFVYKLTDDRFVIHLGDNAKLHPDYRGTLGSGGGQINCLSFEVQNFSVYPVFYNEIIIGTPETDHSLLSNLSFGSSGHTGFEQSNKAIWRDGTKNPTAAINWGAQRLFNLTSSGSDPSEAMRRDQIEALITAGGAVMKSEVDDHIQLAQLTEHVDGDGRHNSYNNAIYFYSATNTEADERYNENTASQTLISTTINSIVSTLITLDGPADLSQLKRGDVIVANEGGVEGRIQVDAFNDGADTITTYTTSWQGTPPVATEPIVVYRAVVKVLKPDDVGGAGRWIRLGGNITDHQQLNGIGTNTHAQIDAHIANQSNPHVVTIGQLNLQASDLPNHASRHTNAGQDKIQDATVSVPGLMTAAQATQLNALVTNLGTGDPLDADTLDGLDSTAFSSTGHTHTGLPPAAHAATHITGGSDVVANATPSLAGLMSSADKTKLNGITQGAGGGFDADLLDGQHAAAFLLSGTADIDQEIVLKIPVAAPSTGIHLESIVPIEFSGTITAVRLHAAVVGGTNTTVRVHKIDNLATENPATVNDPLTSAGFTLSAGARSTLSTSGFLFTALSQGLGLLLELTTGDAGYLTVTIKVRQIV